LRHYVYRSKADYERKTTLGIVDTRGALDAARHADRIKLEFSKHNHIRIIASPRAISATRLFLEELAYDEQIYNTSGRA
jgi:hypothetical protein